MISAETLKGNYPIESVQVMNRIIHTMESDILLQRQLQHEPASEFDSIPEAVCRSVVLLTTSVKAQAIVVFTESGNTASLLAKYCPPVPIFALTPVASVMRQLELVWEVISLAFRHVEDTDHRISEAEALLKQRGVLDAGGRMMIVTVDRLGWTSGVKGLKEVGSDIIDNIRNRASNY